jgi:lipopolysaccharide/colanic/teichoic acid biosynthesis glycosyltransferase
MIPRKQEILLGKASIEDIGDLSFLNIEYSLFYSLHRLTKRVFDLSISLFTLIIFSPIILLLLLLKKGRKKQYWGIEGNKIDVTIFNVRNRFIRELPLFFSVLMGYLSLVGSSMFETTQPNPKLICQPGLTGLERIRSIKFNSEDRLALDHYYVQNQSFTMDLEIIMKTVFSN